MYKEKFSKNLKQLLRENKLSLTKLSREINVPQNTMSYYINNIREIRIENLCKIADYFDITLDELCGREEY